MNRFHLVQGPAYTPALVAGGVLAISLQTPQACDGKDAVGSAYELSHNGDGAFLHVGLRGLKGYKHAAAES